jgi:hypothetical protein
VYFIVIALALPYWLAFAAKVDEGERRSGLVLVRFLEDAEEAERESHRERFPQYRQMDGK